MRNTMKRIALIQKEINILHTLRIEHLLAWEAHHKKRNIQKTKKVE